MGAPLSGRPAWRSPLGGLLLACLWLSTKADPSAAPVISDWSPKSGSLSAGTRLTLYGSGFSGDQYQAHNLVQVGPYTCTVLEYYTSDTQVVCETAAAAMEAQFPITLSIDSTGSTVTRCCYSYSQAYTPVLAAVRPSAVPMGGTVTLLGPWLNDMWAIDIATSPPTVAFGDFLCSPASEASDLGFGYTNGNYQLTCQIANGQGADGTAALAGSFGAAVHFSAGYAGGLAVIAPSALQPGFQNQPSVLQVYPTVTAVSPAVGSLAGGTLLTLTGTGFPQGWPADIDIGITAGGIPCTVVASTLTTLQCRTGPSSDLPSYLAGSDLQVPPSYFGFYPGSRGALWEVFSQPYANQPLSTLRTLASNTSSAAQQLMDLAEPVTSGQTNYMSRLRTFFTAPVAGNYTFYIASDDQSELWATRNATFGANSTTATTAKLAFVPGWTQTRAWTTYPQQTSALVALDAGEQLFLEAFHQQGTGSDNLAIGVRIPNKSPQWNSVPDVQTITASVAAYGQMQTLTVLTGAAGTAGQAVSFTTANASSLTSPNIAVVLSAGGVSSRSGRIPIAANQTVIAGAIAQWLRLPVRQVNVTVAPSGGTSLTWAVTLASTAAPPLSPFSAFNATVLDTSTGQALQPAGTVGVSIAKTTGANTALSGTIDVSFDSNPYMYQTVPVNASAAAMAAAIQAIIKAIPAMLQVQVSVNQAPIVASGQVGFLWNITWPVTSGDNVPLLQADTSSTAGTGVAATTMIAQAASVPLSGSFSLGFNVSDAEIDVPYNASASDMQTYVNALPGIANATVTRGYANNDPHQGFAWTVTFDPLANPGSQPLLWVDPGTALLGTAAAASVVKVQAGSTDLLVRPITATFLQMPSYSAGLVGLTINGAPYSCTGGDANCTFAYQAPATPSIASAVNAGDGSQTLLPGGSLTITGSGFAASLSGNEVTLGGGSCIVTSATATQIQCTMSQAGTAGLQPVLVTVNGLGLAASPAAGPVTITLRTLTVTGTSPAAVAGDAWSLVNVTGTGFNYKLCNNNQVTFGNATCAVTSCSYGQLTCLLATAANGTFAADVTVSSSDGSAQQTASGGSLTVAATAPQVMALAPLSFPATGGNLTITLEGLSNTTVATIALVPSITLPSAGRRRSLLAGPGTNITSLGAQLTQQWPCAVLSGSDSQPTCELGALPAGSYQVVVTLSSGAVLLSTQTVSVVLAVSSVSPNAATLGGGTLVTVTGAGFADGLDGDVQNVVLIHVPISTSFPNGVVLCDVSAANSTQVTCVTRPHCAADASASDTQATNCQYLDTPAALVELVLCPASMTTKDVLQYTCWADDATPRSACSATPGTPCEFAYSSAHTPSLQGIRPQYGSPGTNITVSGAHFTANTQALVGRQTCVRSGANAGASGFTCMVPDMPVGTYQVLLVETAGQGLERGIPSGSPVAFAYTANVTAVSPTAGSLAGGSNITLTADAPAFNDTVLSANQVLFGAVPCMVTAATRTKVTCTTGTTKGMLQGAYYARPFGAIYLPDLTALTVTASSLESSVGLSWSGPPAGLQQSDYWAASFSGYLLMRQAGSYQFSAVVDDSLVVRLDGKVVLDTTGNAPKPATYAAGYHALDILYWQRTNAAFFTLSWSFNGGPAATIPSGNLFLVSPGSPTELSVAVNGGPLQSMCPDVSTSAPTAASGIQLYNEPTTWISDRPTCTLFFASALTPNLTAVTPTSLASATSLSVTATGFSGQDGKISVTVAGQPCSVISQSSSTVVCAPPSLPAGVYPINATVAGFGNAMGRLSLQYNLTTTGFSPTLGSMYGGQLVTINGTGFAPSDPNAAFGLQTRVMLGALPCVIQTASTTQLTCITSSASAQAGQTVQVAVAKTGVRTSLYTSGFGSSFYFYTNQYTPVIKATNQTDIPPALGLTISLNWTLGVNTIPTANPGDVSVAVVSITGGDQPLLCANPTVANSTQLTSTASYAETLTCQLPALAAGTYGLRLLVPGYGYSRSSSLSVAMTVTSVTPAVGSLGGGLPLTIQGTGFSTNASSVRVFIGQNSTSWLPCILTAATPTSITCVSAPAATMMSGVALPVFVQPSSAGAGLLASPVGANGSIIFTYRADLTAQVVSISPARGSTEGGTPVTVKGQGFSSAATATVTVAGAACTSLVVVDDATITCLTGKPATKPPAPVPVLVTLQGQGLATGNVLYEYVDLWSRASTWGGGPLPVDGDSIVIPANTTVLLDVPSPRLVSLVLQGTLKFDDQFPPSQELSLQAHYILILGGALMVGTDTTPFPGNASITLYGQPNDPELPVYGAKGIGIREGRLMLNGQPKLPTWTRLAATADVNASSIVVQGSLNWQVGDAIVIASSSVNPFDVDEATITGIQALQTGNTQLALDRPLQFTHLGVSANVAGDPRQVAMYAEVAVLTRHLVVQGDVSSVDNMYGAHILMNTPKYKPVPGSLHLNNVELRRMGQAFRLGRYAIHFHMMGNVATSFIKACAVHVSYNRAYAVHGSSYATLQDNVAYNIMGHTYFLEDGIEVGNTFINNLGILTRKSHALLNTDTTPATFWVTHPNNTLVGNVAAGSEGYGYWYRMLTNPEGPSFTTSVCPKFTPLAMFANNVAHSNDFYGLRIFPEYYPDEFPCNFGSNHSVPAVFQNFLSYKNGMKGAIATQVGLVQFKNFTIADCGGGPHAHLVNGKDNGGGIEFTWIVDSRYATRTALADMSGVQGALVIARSVEGQAGTAGWWPRPDKGMRGVITQSAVQGDSRHSALLSLVNVTLVGYEGGDYYALEACAKCKTFQGGASTYLANMTFIQSPSVNTALATWSWQHQGVYVDTDGSLLQKWFAGATKGTLLADSAILRADECRSIYGSGAVCNPNLRFRRTMLNNHAPSSLMYRALLVTDVATNQTSRVEFSHYNDDGYQFAAITQRTYWLHWDTLIRTDPSQYTLRFIDKFEVPDWLMTQDRQTIVQDHYSVSGRVSALGSVPLPGTDVTGAVFYNKTLVPALWGYYNETVNTVLVAGDSDTTLNVQRAICPVGGCYLPPPAPSSMLGRVLWSTAPWPKGSPPQSGDDVIVPQGWDLLLDINTPALGTVWVEGNLTFADASLEMTAVHVVVRSGGHFSMGTPSSPIKTSATLSLVGNRGTPPIALSNSISLGAKVLAAIEGTIDVHGQPVLKRWTRLATAAAAGDTSIKVADPIDWAAGLQIVIASTTFNPLQAEVVTIHDVGNDMQTIVLEAPLAYAHGATTRSWTGTSTVLDMRAEVGLLGSNVVIRAVDGLAQYNTASPLRDKFGAHVFITGPSTARINNTAFSYCGQAGLGNACLDFTALQQAAGQSASYVRNSATFRGMDSALHINSGGPPVEASGNVFYESYDVSGVLVEDTGHNITGNLAMGTIKVMTGLNSHDMHQPATFEFAQDGNIIQGNVAAGSQRMGFIIASDPCSLGKAGALFSGNTAHTNLVGMILNAATSGGSCTQAVGFTTYLNWDFGILSMKGITTDVKLYNTTVAENKHAGVLILKLGGMDQTAQVDLIGGVIAGQSADTCNACVTMNSGGTTDSGCPPVLSRQSYNQASPFGESYGFLGATFAQAFTPGPEKKPWDGLMGYPTVYGKAMLTGLTFADFSSTSGPGGCSAGQWALANHIKAADAFHPHYIVQSNRVNVSDTGLMRLIGPDPSWRNPSDCDDVVYKSPADGSSIPLNCQGPKHIYYRDVDGSLTGVTGTVLGQGTDWPRPAYAQGSGILGGPCSRGSSFDGYKCVPGFTSTTSGFAPPVVPAAGIWGDPQMFVLESRDADTEDRNFGPVLLSGGGATDLFVPCMDNGWCFGYTCQKRLSSFWMVVASNMTYDLNFTGTPAKNFRLWLPYADDSAEVVLTLHYFEANRLYAWTEALRRLPSLLQPPQIGDGSPHGAYFWNQDSLLMTVKVKGGQSVELRTESVVKVSATLALSVNDFYDTQETFVKNMAALLGIDVSRIKIATIVPGSTVVTYTIAEDPKIADLPLPTPVFDFSRNIDSESRAAIAATYNQLTPDEQAALFASEFGTSTTPPPPPPSPPSPPVAGAVDLTAVLQTIQASVADGRFATAAGSQLLDLSVTVQRNSAADQGTSKPVTATITLAQILAAAAPPPTPSGSGGSSGSGKRSNSAGVIVGSVVAVAVVAAAVAVVGVRYHLKCKRARAVAETGLGGDGTPIAKRGFFSWGHPLNTILPAAALPTKVSKQRTTEMAQLIKAEHASGGSASSLLPGTSSAYARSVVPDDEDASPRASLPRPPSAGQQERTKVMLMPAPEQTAPAQPKLTGLAARPPWDSSMRDSPQQAGLSQLMAAATHEGGSPLPNPKSIPYKQAPGRSEEQAAAVRTAQRSSGTGEKRASAGFVEGDGTFRQSALYPSALEQETSRSKSASAARSEPSSRQRSGAGGRSEEGGRVSRVSDDVARAKADIASQEATRKQHDATVLERRTTLERFARDKLGDAVKPAKKKS